MNRNHIFLIIFLGVLQNVYTQDYSLFTEDDIIVDGDPAYLRFYTFGTERGYISHNDPDIIINNGQPNGNILFRVDGGVGNDVVIQSGGHVGINQIGPTCALHVVHGNSGATEGLILENESNGNFWRIYSASSNNVLRFYNSTSPTTIVGSFAVDGIYTASDQRLKQNITNLPYRLEHVMKLRPKYYQYNSEVNKSRSSLGFIAQDVQQVIPELVLYDDEEDTYLLNYGGIGVLAIKAIQDQQEIITNQKDEIHELKARMESLEQKIEALLKE